MKVGVIQSNFLPWRGYFDFIKSVDLFIYYDDVQFSKGSWRNRNKFRTKEGTAWFTVPVKKHKLKTRICDVKINYSLDWKSAIFNAYEQNYRPAPFYQEGKQILEDCLAMNFECLSELNRHSIGVVNEYLMIKTLTKNSSEFQLSGSKTERLIDLLIQVGATKYLSGPSAKSYLDEQAFSEAGIALEYKSYRYEPYEQLGQGFEPETTIIDLIANCGERSRSLISSIAA